MATFVTNIIDKGHGVINDNYWIADVLFILGMVIAIYPSKSSKIVVIGFDKIYAAMLKNKQSDDLIRHAGRFSPHMLYRFVRVLLLVSSVLTAITFNKRKPIINLLYFFYSFTTAGYTIYDVLLHDDRKVWPDDVKRRHILSPFMDERKLFAQNMGIAESRRQVVKVKQDLKIEAPLVLSATLIASLALKIIPLKLGYLTLLPLSMAYAKLINLLLDYLSIGLFNNRWPHIFGNNFDVLINGTYHDPYGRQYQYFLNWNAPLEHFMHKEVFKKLRSSNCSTGEAKGGMILARGLLFTSLLYLLDFAAPKDAATISIYYCLHALFAWYHDGKSDHGDDIIKRHFYAAPELFLSGFLFFKPLLDRAARVTV